MSLWRELKRRKLCRFTVVYAASVGALRLRTVACKDRACHDWPLLDAAGNYDASVVLDFDYTVLLPRRVS